MADKILLSFLKQPLHGFKENWSNSQSVQNKIGRYHFWGNNGGLISEAKEKTRATEVATQCEGLIKGAMCAQLTVTTLRDTVIRATPRRRRPLCAVPLSQISLISVPFW